MKVIQKVLALSVVCNNPLVRIHKLWQKLNPKLIYIYIYVYTYIYIYTILDMHIIYIFLPEIQRFHWIIHVQHYYQENSLSDPLPNHVPPCSRFQRWLVSIVFSGVAACEISWPIFIQCQRNWVVVSNIQLPCCWQTWQTNGGTNGFKPANWGLGRLIPIWLIDFKMFQMGWNPPPREV